MRNKNTREYDLFLAYGRQSAFIWQFRRQRRVSEFCGFWRQRKKSDGFFEICGVWLFML